MTRTAIAGGAILAALALIALAFGYRAGQHGGRPAAATALEIAPPPGGTRPAPENPQGFLYGRVTGNDGAVYQGRLRFGGDQEAFWGDFFNGAKRQNPWAAQVPPERLPREGHALKLFGVEIIRHERRVDLRRLFVARLGDIARIESQGRDVLVTMKSGSVFDLDRFDASDFDDGVRVWDDKRGAVDLDSMKIKTIELLPTPSSLGDTPIRLHGTVRTLHGEFTGFIHWDREECAGTDTLDGKTGEGDLRVRFDTLRSIAKSSSDSVVATLRDGRTLALSGTNDVGRDNRGVYVDDSRYGRVLIGWEAFERVDFDAGGSGPAYDDFPVGRPLTGSIVTTAGGRLNGRLVFDLDETETVDMLDASFEGVNYAIPFGLVASIVPRGAELPSAPKARVTLVSGEELQLERDGDLGRRNAGVLVFAEGREKPEYVPWTEVERVDLDRPPAMYPPL